ncbi:MAG: MATE family efflux transporter [candidate division Zixibacteria bacterium]
MARDLTKGSIPRHVVALAVPAVLSMFAIVANNFIDTALVGHLGDSELAAVGSAGFIIWIIFSLMDIFSVGALAIIAREYGANDLKKASDHSKHIYGFSIIFSIILALVGILFSKDILNLLNLAPEVESMGETYLMIIFISVPPLFISEVISTIFRSVGDTKTPMIIMLIAVGLNIVLDIFLIYGIWIFPRLETVGAAVATTIAHSAAGIIAYILAKKGRIPFDIFPKNIFRIDYTIIKKMFRIGLPIGASHINFTLVYLAITRIMTEFGTPAVASIPVGNRAESLSYMTCFGFYMAVSALVGQNLGAKNPARASKSVWVTLGFTSIATLFFTIIFFVFSKELAQILTDEPVVIGFASSYLFILAYSQIFMGFEFVFEGAFGGAGDTVPHMIISIPGTLIRIPLAYYMAIPLGMGPSGIFWAITISTVLKGIAIFIWFRFAKWRKQA